MLSTAFSWQIKNPVLYSSWFFSAFSADQPAGWLSHFFMLDDQQFDTVKAAVLDYIQNLFEEMEEEMAMSHQEKYALLEDALENATDADELRVAFEQWYAEHSEELSLDQEVDELWQQAVAAVLE